MVGYGKSLSRARRPGWEDTYLDYDSLNKLLKEIDHLCGTGGAAVSARLGFDVHAIQGSTSSDSNDANVFKEIDEDIQDLFHLFLTKLQTETEKVSLFVLSKQGQLADAVGALRFGPAAGQIGNPITSVGGISNDLTSMHVNSERSGSSDEEEDDDDAVGFGRFGEEAALLPSLSRKVNLSRSKDLLSSPKPIFGGTDNNSMLSDWKGDNKMDSYTVLGIELLHILRYICVNAMGIRKILKKHNKLLAKYSAQFAHSAEFRDRSDWDKSLVQGQSSDYRLVGGADGHLQQLANSNSMAAVNASLIYALAGFEQAAISLRSDSDVSSKASPKFLREHRRTKTNPHISIQKGDEIEVADMMEEGSHPSSLTRLQCTLWSINTLREYAQVANQSYEAFLSRKAMIVTGDSIGGLKGTTKQALEVLLHFQPDSILYMDESALENWQKQSAYRGRRELIGGEEEEEETAAWGGINSSSMIINLMSILLYTVNYYIVAPTANHYAVALGTDGAFGATLIGASSFAALFSAFLYSFWYTSGSFRSALLFSAFCPFVGNLMYALAISYDSMKLAIWGRILVGFGSAEVVNRQVISTCVTFQSMTRACALFVTASAVGMSIGPLLAGILDSVAGRDANVDLVLPGMAAGGIIYNHVTSPGFVMALLWFMQILALLFIFREPYRINGSGFQSSRSKADSTSSDNPVSLLGKDVDTTSYGTEPITTTKYKGDKDVDDQASKRSIRKRVMEEAVMTYRLIFHNPALPITFYLFAFIELTDEILISSCSMVVKRYFSWHGSSAGFLIASLGALVLPAHFVVEIATHHFEERQILKYSTLFILVGLLGILNYEGLMYDTLGYGEEVEKFIDSTDAGYKNETKALASLLNHHHEFPYDWGTGKVVYIVSLSAIFMGTIILEGVVTTIMSKATPPKLNERFINSGLLATLIGTMGRVISDSMITIGSLLDKSVYNDFVNVTFIPVLPLVLLGLFLIQRYYKLLI